MTVARRVKCFAIQSDVGAERSWNKMISRWFEFRTFRPPCFNIRNNLRLWQSSFSCFIFDSSQDHQLSNVTSKSFDGCADSVLSNFARFWGVNCYNSSKRPLSRRCLVTPDKNQIIYFERSRWSLPLWTLMQGGWDTPPTIVSKTFEPFGASVATVDQQVFSVK